MLRMYLAKSQGLSLHFASAAEQIFASEKQCPADFMYQEIHLTIASLFFFFSFFAIPKPCVVYQMSHPASVERERKSGAYSICRLYFF